MIRAGIFLEEYRKEFGNRKFEKIKNHISNSRHSKNLIRESIQKRIIPTGQDFIETVMSHIRYGVGSVQTITAASMILMLIWLDSIDENELDVRRSDIEHITQRIFQLCSEMSFK